jgi:phage tail-like protein
MAVQRDRPYSQFNFLVDLGGGDTDGPDAGFQECSPIASEVAVVEYRNGNDKENSLHKLTGLSRVADVVLRRGLIGSLSLFEWFNEVRNGGDVRRTVRIQLLNEDHTEPVLTWTLLRARIVKWSAGPLNAKGSDVAIEEMVLAYERLEVE